MNRREHERLRSRALFVYSCALEAGDAEAIEHVLRMAEDDPTLADMLTEVEADYSDQQQTALDISQMERVRGLLSEHLASAYLPADENDVAPTLTVADVAGKIKAEAGVGQLAMEAMRVAQLAVANTPLPQDMTKGGVRRFFAQLGITISRAFVNQFRNLGIEMQMRRERQMVRLAATRKQSNRPTPADSLRKQEQDEAGETIMTVAAFPPADINGTIDALYSKAEIERPRLPQTIVPLGELFGAYLLSCRELPDLSLAKVYEAQGEPFSHQDAKLAGFLFATPHNGVMYINRSDPIPRRRFSTAHELGHYLLHFRPVFDRAARDGVELLDLIEAYPFVEDEDKSEGRELGWVAPTASALLPPLEQMEAEADRFAAELLMPEGLVGALWERRSQLLRDDELVRRMASEMMVSRAAMRRRLYAIGLAA